MMYGDFARVYDKFMEDTPYDEWVGFIESIWLKYGLITDSDRSAGTKSRNKLILDLGCGSGNMTYRLANIGYDMIGIDNSQDMLAQAMLKSQEGVMYLHQDMRYFELYGTVDSVICICDGINYLLKPSDVLRVFKLVLNYLNPRGIFIFDINTEYKYRRILGANSFSDINESSAFIWNNFYEKESRINEYSLSFFIQNENGLYERIDETHYQRAYSKKTIKRLLSEAGLTLLDIFDETSGEERPRSERLFFAAQK